MSATLYYLFVGWYDAGRCLPAAVLADRASENGLALPREPFDFHGRASCIIVVWPAAPMRGRRRQNRKPNVADTSVFDVLTLAISILESYSQVGNTMWLPWRLVRAQAMSMKKALLR